MKDLAAWFAVVFSVANLKVIKLNSTFRAFCGFRGVLDFLKNHFKRAWLVHDEVGFLGVGSSFRYYFRDIIYDLIGFLSYEFEGWEMGMSSSY